MLDELIVPSVVEEIIQRFEASKDAFTELEVHGEICKARNSLKEPSAAENFGAWAEVLAFGLSERHHGHNPWNTYFMPTWTVERVDGTKQYSPDIAGTPPTVLSHWASRSEALKQPVLKARYADLVWEMTPVMSSAKRDPNLGRAAIDAYLVSASPEFRTEIHDRYDVAIRALDIACVLNDADRIDRARGTPFIANR
jgi:hypothetical protein